MALEEKELKATDRVERSEIPVILFDFFDTLLKIKKVENVKDIYFAKKMTDIYVVTEVDDVDMSETIMNKFALWESSYQVFPELHIINKDETFYIPAGATLI